MYIVFCKLQIILPKFHIVMHKAMKIFELQYENQSIGQYMHKIMTILPILVL